MRDAAYWRQRSALLEASAHKNADESVRALEDLYQETQREVRQEIESWYARFARDNQLTLAEAKKRLTAGEMEEFRWSVEQYVKVGKQACQRLRSVPHLPSGSNRVADPATDRAALWEPGG